MTDKNLPSVRPDMTFVIYDSKIELYTNQHHCRTTPEAIRAFSANVLNPESQLNAFPEDFSLFQSGTYSQETGLETPFKTLKHVVSALSIKTQDDNRPKPPTMSPTNDPNILREFEKSGLSPKAFQTQIRREAAAAAVLLEGDN